MGSKNNDSAAADAAPDTAAEATTPEPVAQWRVTVEELYLRGVCRAYRGGLLTLTPSRAAEINTLQPGSLELAGF